MSAVLGLQRSIGNRAVTALVAQLAPGPALALSAPAPDPVADAKRYAALSHPNADGSATIDEENGRSVVIPAAEVAGRLGEVRKRKEAYFQAFADDRKALVQTVRDAGDDAARHTALVALREHDAPKLSELNDVKEALGGTWDIADDDARDAVLGAIQLSAEGDAEAELDKVRDEVRSRVKGNTAGDATDEWCGEFAMDHWVAASGRPLMDDDFKSAFRSTTSLENFFRYVIDPDLVKRSPRWMAVDGKWQEVKTYHAARGSLRQWQSRTQVGHGGFDIRAGDVAILDTTGSGTSDHIVTVQSYDPDNGRLVSVGGNDSGWVPDSDPKHPAGAFKGEDPGRAARRLHAEAATGRNLKDGPGSTGAVDGHVGVNVVDGTAGSYRIYGVGRPSLVDFEHHTYDTTDGTDKPPAKPAPKTP